MPPPQKKQKTLDSFFKLKTVNVKSDNLEKSTSDWEDTKRENLNLSHKVIFTKKECVDIFHKLEEDIEYLTGDLSKVRVFGKWHDLPRKQAAFGDEGLTYKYSGVTVPAKPWTNTLKYLKETVNQITGQHYNFVLVNRYKDGTDKMGEHKDDEKELDENVPIASLTFGAERDFVLKHQEKKVDRVVMVLRDGMLLLMNSPTNKFWLHSLPPRKNCMQPRINLTFRKIKT